MRRTLLLFASLPSVTNLDSAYAHDDGHYEEEDPADEPGGDGAPLHVLGHCISENCLSCSFYFCRE